MEFNGIPMGHLYRPDYSTPTLTQQTIKVTSLKELEEIIGPMSSDKITVDFTNSEDIDDTMDAELAKLGLIEAPTIDLPQRDFNVRTLTSEKLSELKETGVKGVEWNATYN